MTNKYIELKNQAQKELNEFPMFFAFNMEQAKEGMKKLGLELTDADKVCRVPGGGVLLKTDATKFKELLNSNLAKRKKAIEEDATGEGFIFDMFNYELSNHEYCCTQDITDTIDALDITIEEINSNPALSKGLFLAVQNQDSDC